MSAQNQILSTAMTDLELEVTGKGIVNDSTYRQNPLVEGDGKGNWLAGAALAELKPGAEEQGRQGLGIMRE